MPPTSRTPLPHRRILVKTAIFADGRPQQSIALKARIDPVRLSHFVAGRRDLKPREKQRLAMVLRKSLSQLGLDEAKAS